MPPAELGPSILMLAGHVRPLGPGQGQRALSLLSSVWVYPHHWRGMGLWKSAQLGFEVPCELHLGTTWAPKELAGVRLLAGPQEPKGLQS